ncbi:MAG: hypothetical protein JRN06_11490 [Nitrososphaerota archaeon]|nr:hypothetical protein [Nitrososphaerota archaeon]MDG7024694.1 hypothetical protein [Nitrososphaerota archaeon]
MVELTVELTRMTSATYTLQKMGITFKRTLLFRTTVRISTDRLLVSDEAVRVLNSRE